MRKFGQATLIDVSNPLKVLLYYRDFATVVMLDRFLNVVNTTDLRKQGILQRILRLLTRIRVSGSESELAGLLARAWPDLHRLCQH